MKKTTHTDEQIVGILKEVEVRITVSETCRKYGINDVTYYNWKAKKCLRVEMDTSIRGERIAEILSQITDFRGLPDNIIADNGTDIVSNAMDAWAYERGVKQHFTRPRKPVDNAFIESFNGKFRDKCLNLHWFMSLSHSRKVIEEWRNDYNL